jgi:hypothetical protein
MGKKDKTLKEKTGQSDQVAGLQRKKQGPEELETFKAHYYLQDQIRRRRRIFNQQLLQRNLE